MFFGGVGGLYGFQCMHVKCQRKKMADVISNKHCSTCLQKFQLIHLAKTFYWETRNLMAVQWLSVPRWQSFSHNPSLRRTGNILVLLPPKRAPWAGEKKKKETRVSVFRAMVLRLQSLAARRLFSAFERGEPVVLVNPSANWGSSGTRMRLEDHQTGRPVIYAVRENKCNLTENQLWLSTSICVPEPTFCWSWRKLTLFSVPWANLHILRYVAQVLVSSFVSLRWLLLENYRTTCVLNKTTLLSLINVCLLDANIEYNMTLNGLNFFFSIFNPSSNGATHEMTLK